MCGHHAAYRQTLGPTLSWLGIFMKGGGQRVRMKLRKQCVIGRTKAVAKFNWSGHIDHDNHVSQAVAKRLGAQADGSHPDHEPDTEI